MFTPGYIKHGRLLIRHAEKLLRYRKDVLSDSAISDLKTQIEKVRKALKDRDEKAVKAESEQLHILYTQHMPTPKDAAWRENIEVILVAIVVAIGIRSYFLQPFKIPTGSMQPTLNGIIGHPLPATEPTPNILRQIGEFVILGRNYINVVSAEDDQVTQVLPKKFAFFFTFSRIVCERQDFLVYAPPETLRQDFKVLPGNHYGKGETIAKGAVDTGDQVFVDKFTYNFVKPHRGDVFVFRTDNIFGIPSDPETGAPFFIKRLGGVPGDTLRIDPPLLYVNGKLAEGFGFRRVMAARDGYRGYAPGRDYLSDPTKIYTVLERHYFAMGDNSYNSLDSRWWGPVPEENLVGRGLLVDWPFNRHWGLIR
jgi:signal peptidase I